MSELPNRIIEESESLTGDRMATVTDNRGNEYVVNIDKLATTFVQSLSDYNNEMYFGWTLNTPWYEMEFARCSALVQKCARG